MLPVFHVRAKAEGMQSGHNPNLFEKYQPNSVEFAMGTSGTQSMTWNAGLCQYKQSYSTFHITTVLRSSVHMVESCCSSKDGQDQRLPVAHGQVHTEVLEPAHTHTHIDAHGQREGVLAEAECVCPLQGRGKEREQKS